MLSARVHKRGAWSPLVVLQHHQAEARLLPQNVGQQQLFFSQNIRIFRPGVVTSVGIAPGLNIVGASNRPSVEA